MHLTVLDIVYLKQSTKKAQLEIKNANELQKNFSSTVNLKWCCWCGFPTACSKVYKCF